MSSYRIIVLLEPIEVDGRKIEEITLRPFSLDHTIRWGNKEFLSTLALLAEISNLPEGALRALTYPDADRVLLEFLAILPQSIADDFRVGRVPLASPPQVETPMVEPFAEQGSGRQEPLYPDSKPVVSSHHPNEPPPADPIDPRFPASDLPIPASSRFKRVETNENDLVGFGVPPVAKAVNE